MRTLSLFVSASVLLAGWAAASSRVVTTSDQLRLALLDPLCSAVELGSSNLTFPQGSIVLVERDLLITGSRQNVLDLAHGGDGGVRVGCGAERKSSRLLAATHARSR